jgi:hypothetical protein
MCHISAAVLTFGLSSCDLRRRECRNLWTVWVRMPSSSDRTCAVRARDRRHTGVVPGRGHQPSLGVQDRGRGEELPGMDGEQRLPIGAGQRLREVAPGTSGCPWGHGSPGSIAVRASSAPSGTVRDPTGNRPTAVGPVRVPPCRGLVRLPGTTCGVLENRTRPSRDRHLPSLPWTLVETAARRAGDSPAALYSATRSGSSRSASGWRP